MWLHMQNKSEYLPRIKLIKLSISIYRDRGQRTMQYSSWSWFSEEMKIQTHRKRKISKKVKGREQLDVASVNTFRTLVLNGLT